MKTVDDLEIIYLCLETVYALIKKSCLTGKFTKAHEQEDKSLMEVLFMYSMGFNYLADVKLSLNESVDIQKVCEDRAVKLQRFKKVKKGNREIPSLSYFKVPYEEIENNEVVDNLPKCAKNIVMFYDKKYTLGPALLGPLTMKVLFAMKLMDKNKAKDNLILINKIIMKAKSVFIHLSITEENDLTHTVGFVKEHPFNEFIPDILNFLTVETSSVS